MISRFLFYVFLNTIVFGPLAGYILLAGPRWPFAAALAVFHVVAVVAVTQGMKDPGGIK
jgi:hypothetical protein